jgi:sugar O-acyltransferase (sialic acid O-acetyltransferase NeuD family)
MPAPVIIPLLNPNEPEAMITALHVVEGQQVTVGQPLITLETTKSSTELQAEANGFVVGLQFRQGQMAIAGDMLCYLAEEPDWTPPKAGLKKETGVESELTRRDMPGKRGRQSEYNQVAGKLLPAGLRITQPALSLANQLGLDPEEFPTDRLITENLVRAFQRNQVSISDDSVLSGDLPQPSIYSQTRVTSPVELPQIIIYGGGGHGKTLVDLLRSLGIYRIAGFVDDGIPAGNQIMGLPVLGGSDFLPQLYDQGVELAINAIGGISNLGIRLRAFQNLAEAGYGCPTVVHPSAVVEESAVLEEGVQVFSHAYIGSESRVGFGCIVNTGAIVSHDCRLGDYANVSPGAMLAGEVRLGSRVLVGMGVTIYLQVKVGAGARIGNGATIKEDVPENWIVRAGAIWP